MFHADNLLGLATGNVVWNNYETRFYYFPVHFRSGLSRPDPEEMEAVNIADNPGAADARASRWERLLREHLDAIDVLVVFGRDPRLDAINARWFHDVGREGPVRILLPKP